MRSAIAGFAAGVCLLQVQAELPAAWLILALGTAACLSGAGARAVRRAFFKPPVYFTCGTAAGFVWAALFAQHYLAAELPAQWEGRDLTVIGTIDSLPAQSENGTRFNFAVERVLPADRETARLPPRLALGWYAGFDRGQAQPVSVQPGERWQLTVRLKRPHGNANPEGFDYEAWLLEQNLRATGYVRPGAGATANRRLDSFVFSFGNAVEYCRARLRQRILDALPDHEYAGVLVALVVGDQRAIDQSDWKVFNRTGIGHLISISGLHITMVAGLFAALISALWRRSFFMQMQLPLLLPAQKAAALAGAAAALLYVLLAGFGVPAQRTLYMLSVVAAALWFGRITSVSHVLCLALGVVLVLDPWAVLWPGFWLSFGAVALILYASVGRTPVRAADGGDTGWPPAWKWLSALKPAFHTQYVVTLGLVPLTMLLFGQFSLVSPLANALAIPLVSLVVTPLALVGSVLPAPLSGWLLRFDHGLVEWLAQFLQWLSGQAFAVWSAPVPPWWIFLFAMLGVLWLLAPRGWPLRWLGLAAWAPLLLNQPARPPDDTLWVTAFDVGQGMALLVETPHHRLLYDTGPYYSPESDGGSRVILPYLKARGIDALDAVLVSHNDNDHSGGALSLFDELKIGWVASSLASDSKIVRAAPHHRRCLDGQGWDWDGARFELLNPPQSSYDSSKWKPNALSCVLKVTLGAHSILLAGDIEAIQEDELLGRYPDKLRASVLVAPHHGSGTSSTLPFLQAVQPQAAVFQVGYRNRFHHPKPEVFERYRGLGIERLRSDDDGAVTIRFGRGIEVSAYRREHRRYWYGR